MTTAPLPPTGSFIGGAWRTSGATFDVLDPANGSVLARVADASIEDCQDAVDAAARAFATWSETPARQRAELLRAVYELLAADVEGLATVILRENGKSWPDAIAEARYSIEFFRWFSEEASRVRGDYRRSPDGVRDIIVTHQPIGVAVLITPWNFPAAMVTRKIAPALAAGCTVVLKPARETPLTAAYVFEAMQKAGVPAGVVNLVAPSTPGPAVQAMLEHRAVRKLSFTGSTEVGRVLLAQAAGRVISCAMELGGNAPLIVLPGADLDVAVEGTFAAKFRNGGSACTAANRLYLHSSIKDAFLERFSAQVRAMAVGPGSDRSNTIGSLVSERERDKVASLVDAALEAGAERVAEAPIAVTGGAFYPPTVLAGVAHGSAITTTEIFGPVAAFIEFADVEEAVRMANDSEFGLVAYVFGEEGEARRVAERLDVGMVGVNTGVISDPAAPFGGTKQSGVGREGGFAGIGEFLEEKYLAIPR